MRIKEEQSLYDAHGKRTHVVLPFGVTSPVILRWLVNEVE